MSLTLSISDYRDARHWYCWLLDAKGKLLQWFPRGLLCFRPL